MTKTLNLMDIIEAIQCYGCDPSTGMTEDEAKAAILSRIREVVPGEMKEDLKRWGYYKGWQAYREAMLKALETL